jgi:AraC-like DNA-binding protein
VQDLTAAAGLSRSTLSERFEAMLGTSPMRYIRDWRLCLASVALSTTSKGIAAVAHEAGYGTEAAFSRAFSRAYGAPPAAWRQNARQG